MKKMLSLAGLVVMSVLLYLAVFSVVHRPLVVGEIQRNLDFKLAYAKTLPSPKIVILAGSNGRYSHRCEMLTQATGLPCVNASIGVGIGLDFQLDQWRPLLKRGDVVYMPLEYSQYRFSFAEMHGGLQNALMVHSQRDYLLSLDARRIAAAYGSFDLPFLIHGLGEMALERKGFWRRSSTESLTPQGDEKGHTAEAGKAYEGFLLEATKGGNIGLSKVPDTSDTLTLLEPFLTQMRSDGVTVVGGLPTLPSSVNVDRADTERLRSFYSGQGQQFLELANRSLYPLSCFFDTLSHLNEPCQVAHTAALGGALAQLLASGASPKEGRGLGP